jgi:hypothetical protein
MKQTFFKNIQGHKIEFNRLLYPISYHISTKDIEFEGEIYAFTTDENCKWNMAQPEDAPQWVQEMISEICEAIEENEAAVLEETH